MECQPCYEDRGEINKRLTDLSAKVHFGTDQQLLIKYIAKESTLYIGQTYLRIMRLKYLMGNYNERIETLSEYSSRALTNYKLSYENNRGSITIRINRDWKKKNNDIGNFQGNKDETELSSSIVELESTKSEAELLSLPVRVQDIRH